LARRPSDVTLAIRISSLNPFHFSDGGLWSDLIPREKFRHHFFDSEKTPILEGYSDLGIGDFCLRLVCQPSSKSSGWKGVILKYTILLFPASIEVLSDFAESKFPGQMAITICSGLLYLTGYRQHSPLKTYHVVFFKGRETLCGYNASFISDEYEGANKLSSMILPINTNPDGHVKKHRQMALGQICLFYVIMRGEGNMQISVDLFL
jgi:hypothetical protein